MDAWKIIRRFAQGGDAARPVSIEGLRARLVDIIVVVGLIAFPLSASVTFPLFFRKGLQALVLVDVLVYLYLLYACFVRRERTRATLAATGATHATAPHRRPCPPCVRPRQRGRAVGVGTHPLPLHG